MNQQEIKDLMDIAGVFETSRRDKEQEFAKASLFNNVQSTSTSPLEQLSLRLSGQMHKDIGQPLTNLQNKFNNFDLEIALIDLNN